MRASFGVALHTDADRSRALHYSSTPDMAGGRHADTSSAASRDLASAYSIASSSVIVFPSHYSGRLLNARSSSPRSRSRRL